MKSKITEILILAGILVLVFLLILQINDKPQQEKIFIRDTVEKISEKIIYKTAKPKKVVLYKRDTLFRTDIMRVEKSKLGLKEDGEVEIINVKCEPDMVSLLTQTYGFLPGYHMNKKYWITMLLDGSVSEAKILDFLDMSYDLIDRK